MSLADKLRALTPADFTALRLAVTKEHRRRSKIEASNARWTSGEGLEAVLEASIKLSLEERVLEEIRRDPPVDGHALAKRIGEEPCRVYDVLDSLNYRRMVQHTKGRWCVA